LRRIADDHARAAARQPGVDRGWRERGEQRYVHRAQPPDAEQGDQVLPALAHQRGDPVPGADAEPGEAGGERVRLGAQLAVGYVDTGQVRVDNGERDRVGVVAVAEDVGGTGVRRAVVGQPLQAALERPGHGDLLALST